MNKLETFLSRLTDNSDPYVDGVSMGFFLEEQLQVIFSRNKDSHLCFLDIVDARDTSYNTKFEFDLPVAHIYEFLSDNIKNHSEYKIDNHGLTENSIYLNFDHIINPLYDHLIDALDKCEHNAIKSKAFKTRLEYALDKKEEKSKKMKI